MDNSQLQTYKDCPFRYRLQYLEGYAKREEGAVEHDRQFGAALHAGLKCHYLGQSIEQTVAAFHAAYPAQLDEHDLAKTPEHGERLLREYMAWAGPQDHQFEVLAVEQVKEFEIAPGVCFTVKHDLIVRSRQTHEVYGVDHKSTKKALLPEYWVQFDPSSQVDANCYSIQHKYGQCSGFYINALSLGYRKRAYRGEEAGFHWEFQRQLFNRTAGQLEAWKRETIQWIRQMDKAAEEKQWLHNLSGCRFCSYRPICMAGWTPETDREQIEVLFEPRDPLAYLTP